MPTSPLSRSPPWPPPPPLLLLLHHHHHQNQHHQQNRQVFDAILGDPPYGVRAGGRKSHAKPDAFIRNRESYIPSTAPYSLTECLADLLELAAVLLVTGE